MHCILGKMGWQSLLHGQMNLDETFSQTPPDGGTDQQTDGRMGGQLDF